MQDFEYLEHTADAKFRAFGSTLAECFGNSAKAMVNVVCALEKIEAKEETEINAEAESSEDLLHKFLENLLFEIETRGMLYSEFRIEIGNDRTKWFLKCIARGEEINLERHSIKSEIKAVTWHEFFLRKDAEINKWVAQVIVDI